MQIRLPGTDLYHFRLYHHWLHRPGLDGEKLEYSVMKVPCDHWFYDHELDDEGLGYVHRKVPDFASPLVNRSSKRLTPSEEEHVRTQSSTLADKLVRL